MADNPILVSVYGRDNIPRARRHGALILALLENSPAWAVECVESGASLVGVAAWASEVAPNGIQY